MIHRLIDARGRIVLLFGAVCLLALLAACQPGLSSGSPTSDVRKFVAEPFRVFAAEHRALLGEPEGVSLRDGETRRMVQYFDNARLEYDATFDAVLLTPLGVWAHEAAPTQSPPAPLGVAEAFDRFHAAYGGEALLGPALGGVILENERWVRYYANVRLEWDPALPAGRRVQPGPLGRAHYNEIGVFLAAVAIDSAIISDNTLITAADVDVDAFATLPVVFGDETQTLVVVVTDLTSVPLNDIYITATLSWAADSLPLVVGRTDEKGLVRQTLDLSTVPPGSWVVVTVTASYGDKTLGETRFRFQRWW